MARVKGIGQRLQRVTLGILICLLVIMPINSQPDSRSNHRATDCALVTGMDTPECQALVDLYNSTNGGTWTTKTGWLTDNAPCGWFGVTCSGGHVQKLNLHDNKLNGSLPTSLGNLTSLTDLLLQDNLNIGGNLPASLSNLAQLEVLLLFNNKFSGSIPASLANLPLERLNLSENNFAGGIPLQLGNIPTLRVLNLSGNLLSGSVPSDLGSLANLEYLYLDGNLLNGVIPSQLGNLTKLIDLDLSDNKLTGTIPASLNNLTNLVKFRVAMNLLTGTIPDLSNLTNVEWFYLNFNNLTGDLPSWFGGFTKVRLFYINNNFFTGVIPPELGSMTMVEDLHLGGNSLTGTIPDSLGNLPALKNLYLGSNKLTGGFPNTITNDLTNLMIAYNLIEETDPAVVAYLDMEDPDWDETQTISPDDVSATVSDSNLIVNWTPILYTGDGGNYIVHCSDGAAIDVSVNTVDKTASEVVFSGLPGGNYTCSVQTFTPAHPLNFNDLLSGETDDSVVNPPPANQPPNDLFQNPIVFDGYPRQNYSFNIANATTNTDPVPPENDPNCAVDLPDGAAAVHYFIDGAAPGLAGVGDQGIVIHAGGPGWFSRAPAADTAIVVYELNNGLPETIIACADDNAPGEVSVSNAKFDLDVNEDYQVVVWNEGAAPEGAIIEMGLASFDLVSPPDSTIFTQPAEPTSFTWKAYDGTSVYYFDIARTSDAQLPSLRLNELTPFNSLDDGLVCDETLCTLNILAGSTLDVFLNNNSNPGNYIWSVAAKVTDPNNGNSTVVRDSNQIFRLVIAADGEATPTATLDVTETPTPTGTPPIETPTPTLETGIELLVNGGFETDVDGDKIPDGWTVKNPTGDKIKCNKPDKPVAHSGECAFLFKGNVGELSSLEQDIEGAAAGTGDALIARLWTTTKNVVSGAKFSVKIKYTTAETGKIKITLPNGTQAAYIEQVDANTILADTVVQFKLKIKNKNTAGKLLVDDVSLRLEPQSGLIPVPPAGLTGRK